VEKSYLETAHTLGYQGADAQEWVSAVMSRLQRYSGIEVVDKKVKDCTENLELVNVRTSTAAVTLAQF
jgi:hypothetical protein